MMQEDLNFDTPHCIKCGVDLILNVNWTPYRESKKHYICDTCNSIQNKEQRQGYKKINKDPNKVWDPEYLKTCPLCKKTQKAEEYHAKNFTEKDGYNPRCKLCVSKVQQTPSMKHADMRKGAKRRKYEWTLELQDTSALLLSDCYYCGKPSQEEVKIHGLDRVENDRGYHLDNVVTCCEQCNMGKHTSSQEEFIEMCKRVADRHTTYEKSNAEWIKVYLEDSGVGEIIKENFIDPIW